MKSSNEMAQNVFNRIDEYNTVYRPRRRKKIILLTFVLLLITAVSAVGVTAVVSRFGPRLKRYPIYGKYFADESVAEVIDWKDGNEEHYTLYYTRSIEIIEGRNLHYYVDQNEREYTFDDDGRMISVGGVGSTYDTMVLDESLDPSKRLDDETAITIASAYVIACVGEEKYEQYDDRSVHFDQEENAYHITFTQLYNGFISGPSCKAILWMQHQTVEVMDEEGEQYISFDPALLEGVTKETIEAYVKKRMERAYGEGRTPDYEISSCILMLNTNDRYYLSIDVTYPVYRPHVDADKVLQEERWEEIMYLVGDPVPMTKETVISRAKAYAQQAYGADYIATLNHMVYLDNSIGYDVMFVRTYREIFELDWCSVEIKKNGTLSSVSAVRKGDYDDFDFGLLDTIEETEIRAFINTALTQRFGKQLVSWDWDGTCSVCKKNEKFYMSIAVGAQTKAEDDLHAIGRGEVLYYELGGVPMSDAAAVQVAFDQP